MAKTVCHQQICVTVMGRYTGDKRAERRIHHQSLARESRLPLGQNQSLPNSQRESTFTPAL